MAAVTVRVSGVFHSLEQCDAAAGTRDRAADLDCIEADLGSHAELAADDVGDVRAVAASTGNRGRAAIDRICVRGERTVGPDLANEVMTCDHACRREEAIARRVARVGRGCPVGRRVGCRRAGAAECGVRVVDAGVEDRDLDALALVDVLQFPGRDVGHCFREVKFVVDHARNARDRWIGGDLLDRCRVCLQDDRIQYDLDVRDHLRAGCGTLDATHERVLFEPDLFAAHDLVGRILDA